MNAAQLRSKTIELGAESPIEFEMQDGTVLRCVATKEIPNVEEIEGVLKKVGPSRLVFILVDPLHKPLPLPEKVAGKHTSVGTGW